MIGEWVAFKAWCNHGILAGKLDTTIRVKSTGEAVRENYVVLWASAPGRLVNDRLTAAQDPDADRLITYDVRAVAVDDDGVMLLADAVIRRCVGHALTVPGRACDPMGLVEGVEEGRVEYDRATRLYYLDLSLRFWSRRSAA